MRTGKNKHEQRQKEKRSEATSWRADGCARVIYSESANNSMVLGTYCAASTVLRGKQYALNQARNARRRKGASWPWS